MYNQPKFPNKKFPYPVKKKVKFPVRSDIDKSQGNEVKKLDIVPNTIDYILVYFQIINNQSPEPLWKMVFLTQHLVYLKIFMLK